jgi:hypothetical protein
MSDMRAVVGLLGGVVMLFIGFQAFNQAAVSTRDTAVVNGTNSSAAAWNMSTGVLQGAGQAGSGIVWAAIGGVVLIALGILVFQSPTR